MKVIFTITLCIISFLELQSQKVFYQEICNCGVAGAGYSFGVNQLISGNVPIQTFVASGSAIKKAFLFGHRAGNAPDFNFNFNNSPYQFNLSNQITKNYFYYSGIGENDSSALHFIDVTKEINPNQLSYQLSYPSQPIVYGVKIYMAFYLLIIYEHSALQSTVVSVALNEESEAHIVNYSLSNLMPIDT